MKKICEKGITLVALVVTIVVLLILAGVSIRMILGNNGIINKAIDAKESNAKGAEYEYVNLATQASYINGLTQIERDDLENELGKYFDMNECTLSEGESPWIFKAKYRDYTIYSNGKIEEEDSAQKNEYGFYYGVVYKENSGYSYIFYKDNSVEVFLKGNLEFEVYSYSTTWSYQDGKIYMAQRIGTIEDDGKKIEFVVQSNHASNSFEAIATSAEIHGIYVGKKYISDNGSNFIVNSNGTIKITDSTGNETIEDIETVSDWAISNDNMLLKASIDGKKIFKNSNDIYILETDYKYISWEQTSSNNENNEWYAYRDTITNNVARVSSPELIGNMKAIKCAVSTASEGEGSSRWANAQTTDGSMWVWIPRFAYKITKGYHTQETGTIEIKFLDTNNNCLDGSNETIIIDPEQITYTGDCQNEWLLHPAFSSNAENGGGFGEIPGFWFAKFKTSGVLRTGTGLKSIAGVEPLNNQSIGNFYIYARQQLYGETGSVDPTDNYTSFGKSHMVKNSEWGAVVYLSKSVYGNNNARISRSASTTGGSAINSKIYTTNVTQSTTQNVYGIYDMNGGLSQYVASYINNGNEWLSTNGGSVKNSLYGATETEQNTSTKYKTVYATGTDDTKELNYQANTNKKGDAMYETTEAVPSNYYTIYSWESAYVTYPYKGAPFFIRGMSSVFDFNDSSGGWLTCRLALVP